MNFQKVRTFLLEYAIFFVFIVIFIVFAYSSPAFLSLKNLINITRQVSINGLIALGMTLAIISGGIDLSVGSVVALAGMVVAFFAQSPDYNWGLGILAGLLVAVTVGFVNGFLISKFKVIPFIQTLAMMTIARGFTFRVSDSKIINNLAEGLAEFGNGYFLDLPYLTWVFIIFFVITLILLNHTRLGKYIYATGGNEKAARNSGINTNKIKIIVYSLSGLMTGIAGVCLTARVASGIPHVGEGYELDAIAAVVIGGTSFVGGKGTVWGTLIGVFIIGVLNNGLNLTAVPYDFQLIIRGAVIAVAVLIDSIKNK